MEVMEEIHVERYSSYKPSGEDWMGEVPTHWEVRKLKHIFFEKKWKQNPALPAGSISFGEVVAKDDEKIPEATKASYQEVLKGEYLINPLNLNYDLISLRIGLSNIDVVVSSGYIVLKNYVEIDKKYYKYLLHRYDVAYMKLLGSGVRQTISFNHIANSLLAFPPLIEQTRIAQFLDRKTTQIDKAIAQKEKLIELLKERRQILIHNAVTRGLNANVKMKPSGVEWIGEIPEHWSIKKLEFLTEKIGDGLHGTPIYLDGTDFYFINGNNLAGGRISITEQTKTVSEREYYLHKVVLTEQTLLLSINGTIGNVAFYLGEKVMLGKSAAYLNFFSEVNIGFLKLYLESLVFKHYYELELSGSTINNLSLYSIRKTPVIYPPSNEQNEIVSYTTESCAKIDNAIALREQEIGKLKEYKSTLINSAVTGKIRVN